MSIKQSVINTFNRVGIDYKAYEGKTDKNIEVYNRFSSGSCFTTPLIAHLIAWVYKTSNDYEAGTSKVNLSDFDRVRYFILEQDNNAYMTCID